ncbi:uncharacterized protein LOC143508211 isoform X2 [Brachyhypopomus gauderio]|uniref:uncharacterized protein LOC143508211 isoform X2 n=1 Tax=Brachyhypopomus gauderio TaxID=698409 RepID=UPI00404124A3
MGLSDPFSVFQIFVPIVAFSFIIICCVSICKAFQRARRERAEQIHTVPSPSVFVLPIPVANQELHEGPPRYSTVDHYSAPPPYDELELKPDFIPCEPPPAYTESTPSPPCGPHTAHTHSSVQPESF